MKKILRTAVSLLGLAVLGSVAAAQPALKVATVDMIRLLDNYYKTEEANAKLREAEQKAEEQIKQLNDQGNALVEQYKEMLEQSNNTLLNEDARKKAAEDAQRKLEEIQRKQNEVQSFAVNTRRSLQQRLVTTRGLMLEEISKVVVDLAKKRGATVVIDKSGQSGLGIPSVLYADAAYDVTEEALVEINKGAPKK